MKYTIEIEEKVGRYYPWSWFVLSGHRVQANGSAKTERKALKEAERAADKLPKLTPKYIYEYEAKR